MLQTAFFAFPREHDGAKELNLTLARVRSRFSGPSQRIITCRFPHAGKRSIND